MSGALRNEDFRKLLETPRPGATSTLGQGHISNKSHGFTHKQAKTYDKNLKKKKYHPPQPKEKTETDELKEESDARLHEILTKYRDRAAERRKGEIDGQDIELRAKLISGMSAFRDEDEALPSEEDRRQKEIRESKYLGGDLDHTHLVKGLDYSLLNKTRSEIKAKDHVVEEQEDVGKSFQNAVSKNAFLNKTANSAFSRSICQTLFEALPVTKNEFFQRGRMAYVVELEDEQADIPVTLLRSTFECANDKSEQNINANNALINKLTEVLSYLRSDGKRKRKEVFKEPAPVTSSKKDNIYDDCADYLPSRDSKSSSRSEREKVSEKRNYFEDSGRKSHDSRRSERDRKPEVEHNPFPQTSVIGNLPPEEPKPKKSRLDEEDAYGELFPSNQLFYGGGDSDDEDFSKMDMGNKKGPVNRFDFDTQEEYEKYMSSREANTKASYQFGVKASSGRKTRKHNAQVAERKLDRQYEQISKILEKKKTSGQSKSFNY